MKIIISSEQYLSDWEWNLWGNEEFLDRHLLQQDGQQIDIFVEIDVFNFQIFFLHNWMNDLYHKNFNIVSESIDTIKNNIDNFILKMVKIKGLW